MNYFYLLAAEVSIFESMKTALDGIKSDALSAIATAAPYGIAIMGAFLTWKYGINFFKTIAGGQK